MRVLILIDLDILESFPLYTHLILLDIFFFFCEMKVHYKNEQREFSNKFSLNLTITSTYSQEYIASCYIVYGASFN